MKTHTVVACQISDPLDPYPEVFQRTEFQDVNIHVAIEEARSYAREQSLKKGWYWLVEYPVSGWTVKTEEYWEGNAS